MRTFITWVVNVPANGLGSTPKIIAGGFQGSYHRVADENCIGTVFIRAYGRSVSRCMARSSAVFAGKP